MIRYPIGAGKRKIAAHIVLVVVTCMQWDALGSSQQKSLQVTNNKVSF